jgi:hypothetical protein
MWSPCLSSKGAARAETANKSRRQLAVQSDFMKVGPAGEEDGQDNLPTGQFTYFAVKSKDAPRLVRNKSALTS